MQNVGLHGRLETSTYKPYWNQAAIWTLQSIPKNVPFVGSYLHFIGKMRIEKQGNCLELSWIRLESTMSFLNKVVPSIKSTSIPHVERMPSSTSDFVSPFSATVHRLQVAFSRTSATPPGRSERASSLGTISPFVRINKLTHELGLSVLLKKQSRNRPCFYR